jgi:hypothetical protein
MRSIRLARAALLAVGCALVLVGAMQLAAQAGKDDGDKPPAGDRGAKRAPETPKPGQEADHKALTRANQLAISEAHALADRAAERDIVLSKILVSRHIEAIDRALDTARALLSDIEGTAPSEAHKQRLRDMRAAYDRAAGHQTLLQQLANQAQLDADAIEEEARRIATASEDAEAAHLKLIGASTEPARKPS